MKGILVTNSGRWVELETEADGLSVQKIGQTAIGVFFQQEIARRGSEGESYQPVRFFALERLTDNEISYPVMLCAASGPGQTTIVTGFQNRSPYPQYEAEILALGEAIAAHDAALVYGGSKVGLMGAVADAVLAAGGTAIGIIPQALVDKEVAHHGLTELHIVGSMHERKAKMADMAEGFVALPGGIGTLEELVEQLTWSQLGRHTKPIVIANIEGFWDPFLKLLEHMKGDTFIRSGLDVHFNVVDRIEDVVPAILASAPAKVPQREDTIAEKF